LIDVLGIGIIIPVLPYYVESFGAGPFAVTSLFAIFSFFSFFSAPILGAWSDKIGRRPILIISIFSTAIGWLVFAGASSLLFLFIGRIIDGLAAGNFSIAQNYLTDISKDEKERMSNLGLIGGVFGIGFVIGPMLGGLLSSIATSFPFWFVGVLALLNGILAILFLPETNHQKQVDKNISINPFLPIKNALKNKKLRAGFAALFLFGLAIATQQSILTIYTSDIFSFTSFHNGLLMASIGVLMSINQAVILNKVWLKYFSQHLLTLGSMLALTLSFVIISWPLMILFVLAIIISTFGQSILRVTMTNHMIKGGGEKDQGELMGVLTSVFSLSAIVGPMAAGWLYGYSSKIPFMLAAVFMFIAFLMMKFEKKVLVPEFNPDELIVESGEQKMELV
jgi:MFS family permease